MTLSPQGPGSHSTLPVGNDSAFLSVPGGTLLLAATTLGGNWSLSRDGGDTWIPQASPGATINSFAFSPDLNRLVGICGANAVNVISDDGETFFSGTQLARPWRRIAYGGPPGDRKFVAVIVTDTAVNKVGYSITGDGGWTEINIPSAMGLGEIIWNDDRGLWVLAGQSAVNGFTVYTSPDATSGSWTSVFTDPASMNPEGIAQQKGGGVVIGAASGSQPGRFSNDPTLSSWVPTSSNIGGVERPYIAASDNLFIAIGIGNAVAISSTGANGTWTQIGATFSPGFSAMYVPRLRKFFSATNSGPLIGIFRTATPNIAISWERVNTNGFQGALGHGLFTN